jgi:hypothetical protein
MENTCANCSHYQKYYMLNCSYRFVYTNKGYCTHSRKHCIIKNCNDLSCKYWQQSKETKEIKILKFKAKLNDVIKNLNNVIAVINSDYFD